MNEILYFIVGNILGTFGTIALVYQLIRRMPGMAHALIDRYGRGGGAFKPPEAGP